ncbi:hypothetical protein [Teichococcus vastitatis]|uniref:Lipoprotein n=1 Tax=Teichococcus vastitatis TaxID=2307076 RepID=A0ABS9WCE2_9PROT|nr:hypothetical protein [Pseudoroseomonas vastitatis]MCI0756668.1 hypothetical protein [Pseudoroseomonas vastitatis]
MMKTILAAATAFMLGGCVVAETHAQPYYGYQGYHQQHYGPPPWVQEQRRQAMREQRREYWQQRRHYEQRRAYEAGRRDAYRERHWGW